MNIYFACSITGGRSNEPVYQAITAALMTDGHEVPTAHIAGTGIREREGTLPASEVYERDVAWIRACDLLVAEVSTPSHGVGYEIAFALGLGKPVLCLYHESLTISKMISGNSSPGLVVRTYRGTEEAVATVRAFLGAQTRL
jgi:nucleoside 2-deoxyribosyltransferase